MNDEKNSGFFQGTTAGSDFASVRGGNYLNSYSGTSYVTSFAEATPSPSTIMLPITIATAGLYRVAVGAREQFNGKSFDVAVNTDSKITTALGATPLPTFQCYVVGKSNLLTGTNTITITSATRYIDIDYVDVTATTGVATAACAGAEAQKAFAAYPNPTAGQALNVRLELAAAQGNHLRLR